MIGLVLAWWTLLTSTVVDVLPDSAMTPGVTNPAVTPATIGKTICVPNWTTSVRPPTVYTNYMKRKLMVAYGLTGRSVADFELDHLIPLTLGGHPTDPHNLWPQPWTGACNAKLKDRLEVRLNRMVCARRIALGAARAAIATNWVGAYNAYVAPLQCD